ncbi:hypothetical protein [Streptomyces sp. NPDC014734]|uniref:hypothetical protein n=1 Tax=Streptomyces sp. NPDC014734 TaxID=3364886 RepID=UPI0036FED6F5
MVALVGHRVEVLLGVPGEAYHHHAVRVSTPVPEPVARRRADWLNTKCTTAEGNSRTSKAWLA